MNKKLHLLNIIFIMLFICSGYLCSVYSNYKINIFYLLTVPSILGIGVCSFLIAVEKINNE
jgi:cytochrome b561